MKSNSGYVQQVSKIISAVLKIGLSKTALQYDSNHTKALKKVKLSLCLIN
jgi:hypothetical protein